MTNSARNASAGKTISNRLNGAWHPLTDDRARGKSKPEEGQKLKSKHEEHALALSVWSLKAGRLTDLDNSINMAAVSKETVPIRSTTSSRGRQ